MSRSTSYAVDPGEASSIRKEAAARKKARNESAFIANAAPKLADAIRGGQVPLSTAEAKFKARAAEKGWTPHRPSWPDFLVDTQAGLIAVEVKSRQDTLSKEQIATFQLLEDAGVPVYVWKDTWNNRDSLIRWNGQETVRRVNAAPTQKPKRHEVTA